MTLPKSNPNPNPNLDFGNVTEPFLEVGIVACRNSGISGNEFQ